MATCLSRPVRVSSVLCRPTSFARTSLQLRHATQTRWTGTHSFDASKRRSGTSVRRALTSVNSQQPTTTTFGRIRKTTTSTDGQPKVPDRDSQKAASTVESYKPPTTGLLSYFPSSWIPYAELVRLDKPTGTHYLFFPCLFSSLLAAPLTSPLVPPATVIGTSALFFAGALIMRGAGCTINDLWDRNLDPHVARTRLRPIARGAITVRQAIPFLCVQLLAGLGVLLQFPFACLYYGIPSLLLVGTYPLAKRVTNYPQLVLGLTFSWGAIMGFPALGIDLLSNTPALITAVCLYASCVAWTMVYDMIYAYQDIKDDVVAGIKSIALTQERNGKAFLSAVSAVQVSLLACAGLAVGAGPVYFAGTCGGAALTLGYMIWKVDLKSVRDCWAWFRRGAWFTGGAISTGLLAEYFAKYLGPEKDNSAEARRV